MCNWFDRGVVKGISDSTTRMELIEKLTQMGVKAWRYPGGSMTYGYPPTQEAIAVFQDAGLCNHCYGLCNKPLYWASPEEFLDFCKTAGITAWYEINPGFWYDRVNQKVYKTVPMDNSGDVTPADHLDEAVADAAAFALYADSVGVDVVWEIGNEDYVYYKPQTYANLCEAFINGIRAVLPDSKFAVCGDGYNWSDHSFADEFKVALAAKNLNGTLNYSSEHLYLSGVGYTDDSGWHEFDWYTASGHGNAVVSAWPIIRHQYLGSIEGWKNVGYTQTKLAVTEFNTHSGSNNISLDVEHSIGRALGEAQTVVNMIGDGTSSIFLHDMVRTSPDSAWFARIDYYPENPAGRRYFLFPEARAVSLTAKHGQGNLVINSDGLTVSRHADSVYITAINREDVYKELTVNLAGVSVDTGRESTWNTFRAASQECYFFDYHFITDFKFLASNTITIKEYPFSIIAIEIPVH